MSKEKEWETQIPPSPIVPLHEPCLIVGKGSWLNMQGENRRRCAAEYFKNHKANISYDHRVRTIGSMDDILNMNFGEMDRVRYVDMWVTYPMTSPQIEFTIQKVQILLNDRVLKGPKCYKGFTLLCNDEKLLFAILGQSMVKLFRRILDKNMKYEIFS